MPSIACIAVAGPVTDNRLAHITNLVGWAPRPFPLDSGSDRLICLLDLQNWNLDAAQMAQALHLDDVFLLNDFAAIGFGLLGLKNDDFVKLNDAQPVPNAPIACLGAGTGLGEVYLTHNGVEYDVWPSEGGHADFPARNGLEFELMVSLARKSSRCRSV